MNKKILLGSITAVVILVLVSFTGVVGYQTTKSPAITRASPLFSVRSKRAIKQDQDILTSEYLGKDRVRTLQFPGRGNRQVLFQNIINQISMVDDKRYNNFVKLFINHLRNKYKLSDADIVDTLGFLYQLRDSKSQLSDIDIDVAEDTPLTDRPICTIDHWVPTCVIGEILLWIAMLITGILCFVGILTTGPGP